MKSFSRSLALISLLVLLAATAFGQGTSSSLSGTVTTDGAGLPGVTVTVSSPALQGVRTTVTGDGGGYSFPSLPPGTYTVKFELAGMQTITQRAELNLAQSGRADAALKVSSVTEAITVTAEAPSVLQSPTVSTNFDAKMIEDLPIGRTILATTRLAPGVQTSGVGGQTVINGAQSFDNLYLVNGVTVNDQLRGQPENLFIEDAIQETTVLTSGVSAEYGRFTGGVISAITKSGGNEFTGSIRDSVTNDDWTKKTVFKDPVSGARQATPLDKRLYVYEGTLGGRVIRDRLWFFGAGRKAKLSDQRQTVGLNLPYVHGTDEKRYEGKLTGNLTSKHSINASYLDIALTEFNNMFQTTGGYDLRSVSDRQLPNTLLGIHYNGVLTNNFLVEGQYSKKDFTFVGGGSPTTDIINGTLLRDLATARRAWSPTFCAAPECGDKMRNNKDYLVKGTYFLSTKSMGNHSIVTGVDVFEDIRNENNQQSGSNFRIWGEFLTPRAGDTDVRFHIIPTDARGRHSYIQYNPIAKQSIGSSFKTESVFVNDKLDLNNKLSFNVGIRYDRNNSKDEEGIKRSSDSRISPRLGLIFDVLGNGRHRATLNYGRYVAKLDSGVADSASQAGVAASIYYEYKGPEINADGNLTPDQVIKQVFDWFNANGGIDNNSLIFYTFLPGVNTKFKGSLKSPYMDEVSGGYGVQIGTGGYLRGDLIHRKWSDFYTTEKNLTTGTVTDRFGNRSDLGLVTNADDTLKRTYNGAQLQGSYRVGAGMFRRANIGGNYTYSKLRGNVEGETSNNATVSQAVQKKFFPEYNDFTQFNPVGYLGADVRHRANLWIGYDLPTFLGNFNISVLERYHSGQAYSALANIDQRTVIKNPGYVNAPSSVNTTYFFSDRGAFRLDNIRQTDLALNYTLPIKRLNIFMQAEMINAENNDGVEDPRFIRTTTYTSVTSANLLPFNASTQTPVRCTTFSATGTPAAACKTQGANYLLHRDFGKPTSSNAYQLPRTYRVSFGMRF